MLSKKGSLQANRDNSNHNLEGVRFCYWITEHTSVNTSIPGKIHSYLDRE